MHGLMWVHSGIQTKRVGHLNGYLFKFKLKHPGPRKVNMIQRTLFIFFLCFCSDQNLGSSIDINKSDGSEEVSFLENDSQKTSIGTSLKHFFRAMIASRLLVGII